MQISTKIVFLLSAICLFFLSMACDTSSNVTPRFNNIFIKFYGGGEDYEAVDFQQDTDGGYIIIGNAGNLPNDGSNIVMIKTDATGNELERDTLGITGNGITNVLASSIRVTDQGYLVGATVTRNDTSFMAVGLYSMVGNLIGTGLFAEDSLEEAVCSQVNYDPSNQSYLLAGTATLRSDPTITQTVTYRILSDFTVDPQWQSNIISGVVDQNTNSKSSGIALFTTSQAGNFMTFGSNNPPVDLRQFGDFTFYGRRFLLNGQPDLPRNFGTKGAAITEILTDVIRTTTSDYLLVGTNVTGQVEDLRGEISISEVKVSFQGGIPVFNEIAQFTYQAQDPFAGALLQSGSANRRIDGTGYLMTGAVEISEGTDVFLASSGNSSWFKAFGFEGESKGVKVRQNPDGSIMLLATVATFGSESTRKRIALIKTNGEGELKN